MDPNALYNEMMELVRSLLDEETGSTDEETIDLACKVENLDNWIKSGGLLPAAWRK